MGQVESIADRYDRAEAAAAAQAQQKPEDAQTQANTETRSQRHQEQPHAEAGKNGDDDRGKNPSSPPGNEPNESAAKDSEKPTTGPDDAREIAKADQRELAPTAHALTNKQAHDERSMQCEPGDPPKDFSKIQGTTTTLPDMRPTNNPPNRNYVREEAIAPLQNLANVLHDKLVGLKREHIQGVTERDDLRIERASWAYENGARTADKGERGEKKLKDVRRSKPPMSQAGEKRKRDESEREEVAENAGNTPGGDVEMTVEGAEKGDAVEAPEPDDDHASKKRKLNDEQVTPGASVEEVWGEAEEKINEENGKTKGKRTKTVTPPVATRKQPPRRVRKETPQ
ncbi:MAG: hypothetical protein M1831_001880 [Alyxoria varia]|nr:MAG: hypothetical protein M1831_001880 [Alyxoria varia]